MRTNILSILSLLFIFMTSCKSETSKEDQFLADAKAIHKRVITLDTHCDINVKNFTDSLNYTQN